MWTFNEKLKMCEEKTGDGCNIYGGNIFKTESECIGTCGLAPKIETTNPRKKYRKLIVIITKIANVI